MNDKLSTPVSGGGSDQGAADGVNDPGRGGGGDSAGGNYRNPHTDTDRDGDSGSFFGHGGQTDIGYHGGGQAGDEGDGTDNATTRGGSEADGGGRQGPASGPTGPDQDFSAEYEREIAFDGRRVEIVDTSGIAAAEAAGTTGVAGQEAKTTEHPGSG